MTSFKAGRWLALVCVAGLAFSACGANVESVAESTGGSTTPSRVSAATPGTATSTPTTTTVTVPGGDGDDARSAAPASIAKDLAAVPITKIAAAHSARLESDDTFEDLAPIDAPALTEDGKPQVFYVGAEYCPYCASERWAVAVALSKFGTFEGLGITLSAPAPENPADVPTISFSGATYTSEYLSFTGRETESRTGKPLDELTDAEWEVFTTYNAPPYVTGGGGGIPFIDFGGKFIQAGASYSPALLSGKKQIDIAAEMNGDSVLANQVNATAGSFIKAICTLTDDQPSDVCTPFAAS